jgi:hypothetical protein
VLAGYWAALALVQPGTRQLIFNVRDPTLVGNLDGRYSVRSPAVLRRWEILVGAVDRLDGLEVFSTNPEGKLLAWNKPRRRGQHPITTSQRLP